jgi:magnesium chelatase family protein
MLQDFTMRIRFATLTAPAERPEDRGVLARVLSAALLGVERVLVRVEVDLASGLPAFTTVGVPDSAVRERVRTATRDADFAIVPGQTIKLLRSPRPQSTDAEPTRTPVALSNPRPARY